MRKLILRTARRVFWMFLVLLDVMVNRLFNGRVETISTRASRARASGRKWGCVLCAWLDRINKGHCDRALLEPVGPL